MIRRCPYNAIVFALGRKKNPFAISMQKDPAVKEYYLRHFSGHKTATVQPDWDAAKDAVMLEALQAKFGAVEELRALLLGTGEQTLVERTPRGAGPHNMDCPPIIWP